MSFLRQRPLYRILLYGLILILLAGAGMLLLQNRNKASENDNPPKFLSSTTPTPYPLPTKAYDALPVFTLAPGTIVEESDQVVDPLSIEENGQKQAENEYLNLYSENDYLPIDIQWWQQESRQVYEYVSKRLDTRLSSRIIVTFVPPESRNCPHRGLTFPERPVIAIFADKDTSKEQILGVLAHELGHVFIFNKHENLNDLALSEGMATWAAGDYWKEWKGLDFNSSVRDFVNKGIYLPLFENYDFQKAYDQNSTDCVTDRDILYTEMASFIDYIIQKYGMEQLATLFNVPQPATIDKKSIVYPPNYKGVYGLEFNQLEYEWLRTLFQLSRSAQHRLPNIARSRLGIRTAFLAFLQLWAFPFRRRVYPPTHQRVTRTVRIKQVLDPMTAQMHDSILLNDERFSILGVHGEDLSNPSDLTSIFNCHKLLARIYVRVQSGIQSNASEYLAGQS